MPHSRAARKRVRKSETSRVYNKAYRSTLKSQVKKVEAALAEKNAGKAETEFRSFTHMVDRATAKGVVPKNTAARKKSRLAARLNALKTAKK